MRRRSYTLPSFDWSKESFPPCVDLGKSEESLVFWRKCEHSSVYCVVFFLVNKLISWLQWALWVYVKEAQTLTLTGYSSPNTGVAVKKGWNMITPIMTPGQKLVADPTAEFTTEPVIWVWTEDGYRWLQKGHLFNYGTGLWFYSEEDRTLWAK